MFGYKSAEDYYEDLSLHDGKMNLIKIPCFYLHAEDDVLIDPNCLPRSEISQTDNLILATTARGGHTNHIEGGRLGGLVP